MEVFIFGAVNAVLQNLKKSWYNNHLFLFISITTKGKTKIRFLIKKALWWNTVYDIAGTTLYKKE